MSVPTSVLPIKVTDRTVVHGAFGIVFDNWSGVLQDAQNIAGLWPDTGQQQAVNLNVPKIKLQQRRRLHLRIHLQARAIASFLRLPHSIRSALSTIRT